MSHKLKRIASSCSPLGALSTSSFCLSWTDSLTWSPKLLFAFAVPVTFVAFALVLPWSSTRDVEQVYTLLATASSLFFIVQRSGQEKKSRKNEKSAYA